MYHQLPNIRLRAASLARDCAVPAALGVALAVCMPILGVLAFFLRGVSIALLTVGVGILAVLAAWRLIAPSLGVRTSTAIREYAGPLALGLVVVVCMPLIGIVAILARGAALALLGVLVLAAVAFAVCRSASGRSRHRLG